MEKEYSSQSMNETWRLVERPVGKQVFPMMWIYKYVYDSAGMIIGGNPKIGSLGQ